MQCTSACTGTTSNSATFPPGTCVPTSTRRRIPNIVPRSGLTYGRTQESSRRTSSRSAWVSKDQVSQSCEKPGKYHQRKLAELEEDRQSEPEPASVALVAHGEGWLRSDNTPITIGADCAGIGSGIQGIADTCAEHRVEFISEVSDEARRICQDYAQPVHSIGDCMKRTKGNSITTDVYIAGFPYQPYSSLVQTGAERRER